VPVNSSHPQHAAYLPIWVRLRDFLAGEDAVKAAGQKYLPKLGGSDAQDYEGYLARAAFYGATGRTHEALSGAMWRKKPAVAVPAGFEALLENCTLSGVSFETFARQVAREILGPARYGVLVDASGPAGRAYLAGYRAEDVVSWRVEVRAGVQVTTRVVLRESYDEPGEDEFTSQCGEQYRVLDLPEGGAYYQRIFRKRKTRDAFGTEHESWAQYGPEIVPTQRGGAEFTEIPFVFLGPSDLTPEVQKPPLLDLANANLRHYLADADIAHGLHFTALPTPWVAGGDLRNRTETLANGQTVLAPALKIGSGTVWDLPAGAQADMLEFSGAGLDAYRTRQAALEDQMVHLGAQILQAQKRASETAEAMRLRSSGESSILSMIAETVSAGLTKALKLLVAWEGGDAEAVSVALNKDFLESRMDPSELAALVKAWQDGALTTKALVHNLKAGEILPPDTDAEAYEAELDEAKAAKVPPQLAPFMGGFPGRAQRPMQGPDNTDPTPRPDEQEASGRG
jgi:hypothetical protein